jgi:peptidoglycan-associated lipoprotein
MAYPANKIIIEGHADERGTREYNLALGERRANAAREYLISLGVNPNRAKTISFGKERPAIPGSNENAYAQNRRAVAVLSKD